MLYIIDFHFITSIGMLIGIHYNRQYKIQLYEKVNHPYYQPRLPERRIIRLAVFSAGAGRQKHQRPHSNFLTRA